jgi:hypothetical protein
MNFVAHLSRQLLRHRRGFEPRHGENFSAQRLLVKLESRLALPVKIQVGVQLHRKLLLA